MSAANREYFDDSQKLLLQDPEYIIWLDDMSKAANRERESIMNINEVFPSNYLKASDLQGRKLKLKVSSVEMAELGNEEKPVVYFEGKSKGLVLNKTKANILASAWSPETDGWIGKDLALFPTKVNFQGQMVDAIGIEPVVEIAESNADVPF